mgnify:CR=1 FL=1
MKKLKEQEYEKHTLIDLFWECTLRCNLHCLHCGSSCGDVKSEEMPVEVYDRFLREIKEEGRFYFKYSETLKITSEYNKFYSENLLKGNNLISTVPKILSLLTGPKYLLSLETFLLSPNTKYSFSLIVNILFTIV